MPILTIGNICYGKKDRLDIWEIFASNKDNKLELI